jgi:hypothetical protein
MSKYLGPFVSCLSGKDLKRTENLLNEKVKVEVTRTEKRENIFSG